MFEDSASILAGVLMVIIPVLVIAMVVGLRRMFLATKRAFSQSKDTGERYMTKSQVEAAARGIANNLYDQKLKLAEKKKITVA